METEGVAYPALLTAQEEGGFLVEFLDLEGCFTAGDDEQDAKAMAKEALTGWLESELAHGQSIPEASRSLPKCKPGEMMVWIKPDPHVAVPLMLRRARESAGVSQKEMARRMGISYTSYQHLEYPRKFNATVRNLERVGKALGLELDIKLVNA